MWTPVGDRLCLAKPGEARAPFKSKAEREEKDRLYAIQVQAQEDAVYAEQVRKDRELVIPICAQEEEDQGVFLRSNQIIIREERKKDKIIKGLIAKAKKSDKEIMLDIQRAEKVREYVPMSDLKFLSLGDLKAVRIIFEKSMGKDKDKMIERLDGLLRRFEEAKKATTEASPATTEVKKTPVVKTPVISTPALGGPEARAREDEKRMKIKAEHEEVLRGTANTSIPTAEELPPGSI